MLRAVDVNVMVKVVVVVVAVVVVVNDSVTFTVNVAVESQIGSGLTHASNLQIWSPTPKGGPPSQHVRTCKT
jgi:hypothetical protein